MYVFLLLLIKYLLPLTLRTGYVFVRHSVLVPFEIFTVCLLCVIIIKRWNIFVC